MKTPVKNGIVFLLLMAVGSLGMSEDNGMIEQIRLSIPIGSYSIESSDDGHDLSVDNFGCLLIPGKPKLPSKIFTIALPPGANATAVDYRAGQESVLPGTYKVVPSPLPRSIGQEDPLVYLKDQRKYDDNYNLVYGSDDAYPKNIVELIGNAGYRNYHLADIRVTPFTYHPQSGRLTYVNEVELIISYMLPSESSEMIAESGVAGTKRTARSFIYNYNQAESWYPPAGVKRGLYDFVIITLESLTSAVQPLVDWELAKGRSVQVVTTSWIDGQYTGYDQAERIRNFLRDKYPAGEWGIEDALIVGHKNDIPMRLTDQDWGYGRVKTDLYYAELSKHDSLSWDADGDHLWGEDSDPVDFYSEINVGRIPWSGAVDVENICLKTVAYEQNDDPAFKKNILLLGAYFWNDDPNPVTDNAVLMEAKIAHPWMDDWTKTRMYEKNNDCWSSYDCDYPLLNSNVRSVWSSGKFAYVNWAGHGSPTSTHIYGIGAPAFISTSDCPYLNDEYPSIIFADACSNSNPDYTNIGQAMIRQGAVGFLGATQVAGGMPGWNDPSDGSSQSLDYYFTEYLTSGDYTFGEAHQKALRDMYVLGLWGGSIKYQMFQWGSIWGNPDITIARPPMEISLPDGLPEYVAPDTITTITVRIIENADTCIPGSALLHYRFDDKNFLSSQLRPLGGDLYEADLNPPDCDALPQYYFSAEGISCGVIYNPISAPTVTHSSIVGEPITVFGDDFEADNGWSVENSGGLTGGEWERGIPAGGGERGDPPTDYDGSGQCYLTENVFGNSDVDGGSTYLISPVMEVAGIDAEIHYALWYTNNFGSEPNNDYFRIHLSNDNGSNWTLADEIGPQGLEGWNERVLLVSDHLIPTDQVKIRFEASDAYGGSVVEAGIDAFHVIYVDCSTVMYGDANGDEEINIADAVHIINYVFKDGPPPEPLEAGDCNCDDAVDIGDAVYLVNHVFKDGPPPGCF